MRSVGRLRFDNLLNFEQKHCEVNVGGTLIISAGHLPYGLLVGWEKSGKIQLSAFGFLHLENGEAWCLLVVSSFHCCWLPSFCCAPGVEEAAVQSTSITTPALKHTLLGLCCGRTSPLTGQCKQYDNVLT